MFLNILRYFFITFFKLLLFDLFVLNKVTIYKSIQNLFYIVVILYL